MPVALLSRHGEGHLLNPSQVPYRANIYALKALGVTHVLASGAVGSLREEVAPRHLVIPDQVIDRTFRRAGTFFDDLAVHVELAAPFCGALRNALVKGGAGFPVRIHQGGTYVCMEGPQFSTRAESELHRSWGASLIGMTVMPEAKLAREAELCYALVALPDRLRLLAAAPGQPRPGQADRGDPRQREDRHPERHRADPARDAARGGAGREALRLPVGAGARHLVGQEQASRPRPGRGSAASSAST